MTWELLQLPALCAAAAALELDEACVGQWMLSRPLPTGALLGAALGSPWEGAILGAVLELLTLDDLPMGHRIPLNGTVAAATAALLACGAWKADPAAALPAGLAAGHLFTKVENRIRLRRLDEARKVDEALARGKRVPFGRIFAKALLLQVLLVFAFLYVFVALSGPALAAAWPLLPKLVRDGAALALLGSVWLGFASVLQLTRPR